MPTLPAVQRWLNGKAPVCNTGFTRSDSGALLHVGVAQLVERDLAKVEATGPSPVTHSTRVRCCGDTPVFQTGKLGSIPSSRTLPLVPAHQRPL